MLRIAVCDDNCTMLFCINRAVTEFFEACQEPFELHSFTDGNSLLSVAQEESFNILFLDIQLPDIDGFKVAEEIGAHSPSSFIIFITSNDSLVFKTFDYHPFHFIRKGNGDGIDREVKRVLSALLNRIKQHTTVTVAESKSIAIKELVMIEADGHYLKYHMNSMETLRVRGSLLTVGDRMAEHHFIQVHRSYLVNPLHISKLSMQNDCVILLNGKELPLGRNFKKDAARKYGNFCSRENIF